MKNNNKKKLSKVSRLRKNSLHFRRLTGITAEKFDEICEQLGPLYQEFNQKRLEKKNKNRKRRVGAGSQFKLDLEDRLLMLLMYYRTYSTHIFLGFLFSIDDSNIGRNINPLQPLLAKIFKIPEKKIDMSEDEIMDLFFDGTEQQTNRPRKGQKKWYSGKKKKHTIKHQVVVAKVKKTKNKKTKLRIKAVSKSFYGKTHDKRMYEKSRTRSPDKTGKYGDSAYLGTILTIPIKKPKGKELEKEQKEYNQIHSSMRVCVENGIGKMKIWQILTQRFRNRRKDHMIIFKNIAGLQNLMFG